MAFELKTLVYVGLNGGNTHLQGKTAMVKIMPHSSHVLAQFDDTNLDEAYGWRPYPAAAFQEVPPTQN